MREKENSDTLCNWRITDNDLYAKKLAIYNIDSFFMQKRCKGRNKIIKDIDKERYMKYNEDVSIW